MLTTFVSFALAAALQTPLTVERPTRVEVSTSGAGIGDCLVFDKSGPGPLEIVALSGDFDLRLRISRAAECHSEGEQTWRLDQGYPQIDSRRDERFYLPDAPVGRYVVRVYRNGDAGLAGSYEVMVAQGVAVDQGVLASRIRARSGALAQTAGPTPAPESVAIMPPAPAGPRVARTKLSMGEPVAGALTAAGATSADCYYVTTTNPYTPKIETIVRAEGFDAVVGVGLGRDCSAPVIWSDDNGGAETGGPGDARLEVRPERAGDYFIRVDRRDGGSGGYRVMAIVDGMFVVGAGLNSPTMQTHRTTMAAARDRARTEVAGLTYAPPPRPTNWTGLSDGDVYEVISRKIEADVASLSAEERAWFGYHSNLTIKQYLAGVPTWSYQNPSTEELRARQQATADRQAREARAALDRGELPPTATAETAAALRLWNEWVGKTPAGAPNYYTVAADRNYAESIFRPGGYVEACRHLEAAALVLGGRYPAQRAWRCMSDGDLRELGRAIGASYDAQRQQAEADRRWAEAAQSNALRQAFLNPNVTVWSTDSSGRRTSQTMRYQEYQRRYVH